MQVLPIDLTAVIAVILGCLTILIPVAGLTARFALKPVVEALGRNRLAQADRDQLESLAGRLELVEQQLSRVETDVERISDAREFDARLSAGD